MAANRLGFWRNRRRRDGSEEVAVFAVSPSECADNSECCETSEMLGTDHAMTPVDLPSASTTAGKKTINIASLT
jgi:hypothetical protein